MRSSTSIAKLDETPAVNATAITNPLPHMLAGTLTAAVEKSAAESAQVTRHIGEIKWLLARSSSAASILAHRLCAMAAASALEILPHCNI